MTYRGHVENGVVVFDGPVSLPEGAQVRIEALSDEVSSDHVPTTLNERLRDVIGAAQGLAPDASLNVDHYLYGTPKRS